MKRLSLAFCLGISILSLCLMVFARRSNTFLLEPFAEPTWATFPDSAVTPYPIDAVYQSFEHGTMIWRRDENCVYALTRTHSRIILPLEIPQEGRNQGYAYCLMVDPLTEQTVEASPPEGRFLPQGAIGRVWHYYTEIQTALGYATAPEIAYTAIVPRNEDIAYDGATFYRPQLTLPNDAILKCGSRGTTAGACVVASPEFAS